VSADASATRAVIGVGNAFRRDDGLGPRVVERLRARAPSNCRLCVSGGEGTELMALWESATHVILIDVVRAGGWTRGEAHGSLTGEAGTIVRIDATRERVPGDVFHYSSHAFSVAEAIELARTLGELPERVTIYGAVGLSFEAGTGLSPAVEKQVDVIVDAITRELSSDP
jgi:hydrogenase maturation protease